MGTTTRIWIDRRLTWHPRHEFEGSEHPDGPEGSEVDAVLHARLRPGRVLRGQDGNVPEGRSTSLETNGTCTQQ